MDRRHALSLLIWGGIPALAGATTLKKLHKPDRATYFALEQDHVRVQTRGLLKYKWVEGLRAGRYEAVGQDGKGIYYLGPGASVIVLSQKLADNYLSNGDIPPPGDGTGPIAGKAPGVGGLFIPTDLDKDHLRLFFVLKVITPLLGGLTELAIQSMIDGSLAYIDYETEKDFVSGLKILEV
jgi:hypothetical protein